MEIWVTQEGLDSAGAILPSSNLRGKITSAIRSTIKDGKAEGKSLVEARYTARSMLSLGKVKSQTSGLSGKLTISGRSNLIKRFKLTPSTRPPHNPPGGLHVQVVKGQGGYLRHAFVNRRGVVLERTGRGRLPIRHLSTVSLPGAFERIGDKLESKMAKRLQARLEALL